jgi:hypothetical protein
VLDRPLIVLLEQDCADEPDDGVLVGEDADNLGAAFDLTELRQLDVRPLDRQMEAREQRWQSRLRA